MAEVSVGFVDWGLTCSAQACCKLGFWELRALFEASGFLASLINLWLLVLVVSCELTREAMCELSSPC